MGRISLFTPKASLKEQILFARNMSLMIKSGIPLLNCLKLLEDQTQARGMKKILKAVRADVENGQLLSASFKKFHKGLGSLFINVIQVGEASGTLADNLSLLGDELKKKQILKGKVLNALIYPGIIVTISIGLIAVLMFVVFPQILPLFESLDVELPITTRMLIVTSNFAQDNAVAIAVATVLTLIGVNVALRFAAVRYFVQKVALKIPVAGSLIVAVQITVISRTLLVLLHSGVKIVDAILTTGDITTNLVYQKALRETAAYVKTGEPFAQSLARQPQLFPVMFSQMIEVSEAAGTLDTTLKYLNDYYETEVDERLANFIALLEPMLLVFMGLGVALIAISIILPIYSLSAGAGNA